jgi:peptidoglycan hydrolase CwlO-like protein
LSNHSYSNEAVVERNIAHLVSGHSATACHASNLTKKEKLDEINYRENETLAEEKRLRNSEAELEKRKAKLEEKKKEVENMKSQVNKLESDVLAMEDNIGRQRKVFKRRKNRNKKEIRLLLEQYSKDLDSA